MAFVKFSRGLLSTYNNLSRKDPDTLYLVYENNSSEDGYLYLGDKLISGVGNNSSLSLNDLTDVIISGNLEDGMLLQYNASTGQGKWEAVSLTDVISNLPSARDKISIEDSLSNLENPVEKDIAIIGQDVYIYKDNNWIQLSDSNLKDKIGHKEDIENNIPASGLYKEIADLKSNIFTKEEVIFQITNAAHLRYEIVNTIDEIDISDTQKVDNTIFLVPKEEVENNNGYNEYFVINNELEKIGSWDVNLSNYVTKDSEQLLTNEQKQKIDSLGLDTNNQATIQASQVGNLNNFIQENQFIKSVEVGSFEVTPQGQLKLIAVPSVDLSGYVKTIDFNATVGNLLELQHRVSENSTLVQEINTIKESIIWQELIANNTSGN